MPVQGRTRKELRQSIGYNLGALKAGTATGGTTETLIDTKTLRVDQTTGITFSKFLFFVFMLFVFAVYFCFV